MEAVATGDEIAVHVRLSAVDHAGDAGALSGQTVDGHLADLEVDGHAAVDQRRDLVLDHLLLAVDRDLAASQPEHVDMELVPVKAEIDAGVREALAVKPIPDANRVEHINRVLLEQAGPDALLNVLAVARLEYDAAYARLVEEQGESQSGGPSTDDAYLGFHPAADVIRCSNGAQSFG